MGEESRGISKMINDIFLVDFRKEKSLEIFFPE